MDKHSYSKKVFIAVAVASLFLGSIALIIYGINVFMLVFAGLLFSVFLRGIASFISRYIPINTKISLAATIILIILFIYLGVILIGPGLTDGFNQLQNTLPKAVESLGDKIEHYSWGRNLINEIENKSKDMVANKEMVTRVTGIFSTTLGAVVNFFIILIVGIYVAFNPLLYKKGLLKLFPKNRRNRISDMLDAVSHALGWWLVGRIISMLIIGIFTALGLAILNIPMAITLGIIAAILTFVPNIGPVISAVPAVLIGLIQSPLKAVYVVILYIGIQTIESYFITPMVQQRTVSVAPALLISVQILVGVWLGIFGLFLATPLLVATTVVIQMLYIEDTLHDKVDVIGENN